MTEMNFPAKQLIHIILTVAFSLLAGVVVAEKSQATVHHPVKSKQGITHSFTEGPHVFYKRGKVIVKNIHFSRNNVEVDAKVYTSKQNVPTLICKVDDSKNTTFKISIKGSHKSPPTIYEQPEKLYAISDIEGNFEAFENSLKGNGVIDKDLNWTFGKGHLVLVGDFFDRGYNVTPVLWLVYKLDQQAAAAGGMVHFIIGNHEEMNMRGDVRYVKDRYIKSAKVMKIPYRQLYSADTELGRWLRSKNVVERIGRTIFVHGGISPQMAHSRIRLEDMNKYARSYYGMEKFRLEQKGGAATAVFSQTGPMWYRGYFREKLSQQQVDQTLDLYGAKYVVVGHTIVPKVSSLFNGRVIAIDVKHDISLTQKIANSLYFEKDKVFASNASGKKTSIDFFMTEGVVKSAFKAVRDGDVNSLEVFLKSSDRMTRINKHYFSKRVTLLQAAILHNQPDIVKYLLEKGADIDLLSENRTPLMHAIEVNNQYIVDILIREGANINGLNKQKKSPLFYCAKHGNIEIAKSLVERGARIDLKDGKGRTAAEYALKNDNKNVANYLKACKN